MDDVQHLIERIDRLEHRQRIYRGLVACSLAVATLTLLSARTPESPKEIVRMRKLLIVDGAGRNRLEISVDDASPKTAGEAYISFYARNGAKEARYLSSGWSVKRAELVGGTLLLDEGSYSGSGWSVET